MGVSIFKRIGIPQKIGLYTKPLLALSVLIITFVVFVNYALYHPEIFNAISNLNFITIILLFIGYLIFTLINSLVLHYSLKLVKHNTPQKDNLLLTASSSIVNFFGPLQSGPGFRALYLKKKYGIKIKDFLLGTFIFYGFFGFINSLVLLISFILKYIPDYLLLFLLIIIIVSLILFILANRYNKYFIYLSNSNLWKIGLMTLLLCITTVTIYHIELIQSNVNISLLQTITYTSAANMSLFVAITPGSIGIREGFISLTQQLHNISTTSIVSASVIDRSFYLLFLAITFLIITAVQGKAFLKSFFKKVEQ